MIANNEMQLKALLKDLSSKYGITPQATLQMYCLERLLDRIAASRFRKLPLTVDLTTGDTIIPREVEYMYKCVFDDKAIPVLAYPLENVFAEKLDTIFVTENPFAKGITLPQVLDCAKEILDLTEISRLFEPL